MELSQFFPLGEGLELSRVEMSNGELVLHIRATSSSSSCPLCAQPATRLHSRYVRAVKDLPCAGKPLHLILHVRKFFCDAADCARKIFAERLPQLVAPWAQMTTRLCQAIQAASAAYPVFLPALEQRFRLQDRAGNEFEQLLLLTDGGVYDNLGLSVLEVDRDERFTLHIYKVDYIVACDAGLGQLPNAAPHFWPSRMNRVFRIVHGRAQHGERGRLYAAASSGRLSGFVYAYLGMRDDRLPIPIADLVPREIVADYPTNFRAMSREALNTLSMRGEQLVRALLPHYCSSLY